MTAAGTHPFEGFVVDIVYRPRRHPQVPEAPLTPEQKAAELRMIQSERARLAAREAALILDFAADRPDDDDPAADAPGAPSQTWRRTDAEFPGVSEAFPHELAMVLNVGRGTAAHKLRRALTWRHSLPLTAGAQQGGRLDERRAQILADTLAHTDPDLARRVEAVVLPEAHELGFGGLKRRILAVLLELDPAAADENRKLAQENADVFVEPGPDGMATLGASLPADEAAEGFDFINAVAQMAKLDGDQRPISRIRTEIYSLLVRGAALAGAGGVRATLTITAALECLEGSSTAPADVNGFAITPAHLSDLLRRVGALGLHAPDGGDLTLAITDEHGRLIATPSLGGLQRQVRRGQGLDPPAATDRYEPTDAQRDVVRTRDRHCRMPHCGQRTGPADHDHVVPHSAGGGTTCTNLCCLCRSHHRLKTLFRNWLFAMDDDGTLHVTTPSGVTRTTRPWALRRRPPPAPPPERPAPEEPPPF